MSGPGGIVNIVKASPTPLSDRQMRDAEPRLALFREQPFVLPLLLFVCGIGELVKAIGGDQTPARGEFAAFRTKIVDRLAILPRPTPPPLHQVADLRLALARSHDRCRVCDLDVLTRLDVGLAVRKADFDLDLGEIREEPVSNL